MMPHGRNIHSAGQGSGNLKAWWDSIPPVTKTLGVSWLITSMGQAINLLPLHKLYLSSELIFTKFEIWRLVTNVLYLGKLSPRFAFRMLWLVMYSPPLENAMTLFNLGEYAYFISFCVILSDLVSILTPIGPIPFCSEIIIYSILYMWSRNFSTQNVSIWGLVNVQAIYLPWVMIGVDLLFGAPFQALIPNLVGIGIGHLYYFLSVIYPAQTGTVYLKCPAWLSRYMGKYYRQTNSNRQSANNNDNRNNSNNQNNTVFRGMARRLND